MYLQLFLDNYLTFLCTFSSEHILFLELINLFLFFSF
jgi:hypothetical protein